MNGTAVTAGALAIFVLEAIKWAWRKWVAKSPDYDFPTAFYAVSIPLLGFVLQPALAWLGLPDYQIPTNWSEWAKQGVLVVLSSLVTLVGYNTGIRPLKEYNARLEDKKAEEEYPEG